MSEPEAGRALDALVAERVMGAAWSRPANYGFDRLVAFGDDPQNLGGPGPLAHRHDDGTIVVWPSCPDYSTDLQTSWEVVEKLKDRYEGCRFTLIYLQGYETPSGDGPWLVCWTVIERQFEAGGGRSTVLPEGRGETAPLAICRAALLAFRFPEAP